MPFFTPFPSPSHFHHRAACPQTSGSLRWLREVESHPAAIITGAASVYATSAFIGVSSNEEEYAARPGYPCCSFRGSIVSLDVSTGEISWKLYMLPDNKGRSDGYSGAAVWGSSPAVDPLRGLVYAATGNNYRTPEHVTACEVAQQASARPSFPDPCVLRGDHHEAVVAVGMADGALVWVRSLGAVDAWTVACLVGARLPNCPPAAGPDHDFGMMPALTAIQRNG